MEFIRVGKDLINLDLVSLITPEDDGKKTKFFFTAGIDDHAVEDESFESVCHRIKMMEAFGHGI